MIHAPSKQPRSQTGESGVATFCWVDREEQIGVQLPLALIYLCTHYHTCASLLSSPGFEHGTLFLVYSTHEFEKDEIIWST